MSFDPLALQCFVAVAETGSFTHAAGKVSRTQSAVSQQIAKLEDKLGVPLFNRAKSLTLTHNGEVLLGYASKIIQLNREVIDVFKHAELQGEVRFGLPEDFSTVFLSEILQEYSSLHPRILLNIECDLTLNLLEQFKQKRFDLVLLKMSKPEDLPNGQDVWSEALVWVGRQEFFDKSKQQQVPLVLSPQPCVYRARAISALEKQSLPWRIVFSSHSFAGTIAAVKAGMGVTVLPRNMVPKDLKIIQHIVGVPQLDDTHISLLKHTKDNPSVNSFEEFVIQKLK